MAKAKILKNISGIKSKRRWIVAIGGVFVIVSDISKTPSDLIASNLKENMFYRLESKNFCSTAHSFMVNEFETIVMGLLVQCRFDTTMSRNQMVLFIYSKKVDKFLCLIFLTSGDKDQNFLKTILL